LLRRELVVFEGSFVPMDRPDHWYRGKWERSYSMPGRECWRGRSEELAELDRTISIGTACRNEPRSNTYEVAEQSEREHIERMAGLLEARQ
jgi:hypothetical protein